MNPGSAPAATPTVPGAAPAAPDPTAAADRVRSLYAHAASSLVGHALGAAIVAAMYMSDAGSGRVGAWLAAIALPWLVRLGLVMAFRRRAPAPGAQSLRWRWWWNTAALASGALWGLAVWIFHGRGEPWHDLALLLIVNGLCVGSIPSLATQGRVYLGFVSLACVPMIVRVGLGGGTEQLALAGVLALICATAVLLGRNYSSAFEQQLQLKSHAAALVDQLRGEKAAAELARRAAEAASQDKSRFLAAASHDLRQPLHALGLFAQALRGRSHDSGVLQLVERIDAAVDALDLLFTELLDVTRIDTGGVEVRNVDFALAPMLHRLRLHFEPLAFEKGLTLTLRGGHQLARSDPVLVERILRNLTANAIRYTEDGGVLVCARRRGDQLLLQVWDSGMGIAPADQARIFDEFVQLGRGPASVGPGQRKGLGLGLAIVRRLAALIGAAVELRSVPGRGTVFGFRVPAAAGQAVAAVKAAQVER